MVKTAGNGSASAPLQRPSEKPRGNGKLSVPPETGVQDLPLGFLLCLLSTGVEFPFVCISDLVLSKLAQPRSWLWGGSGWVGAKQPGGSSQAPVPFLWHGGLPKFPVWASRPVWYNEATPNCQWSSGETQQCQMPQRPWGQRRVGVEKSWRGERRERGGRRSKVRDL